MILTSKTLLTKILQHAESNRRNPAVPIWLPAIWNTCGYQEYLDKQSGEICVHPYDYLCKHLRYIFELSKDFELRDPTDFRDSVIYSSLVRYSTAWDYNRDGEIESGTFLRMILLLPLLKKMGVNILYLLPVTRYSTLNLKGTIGSPYAVETLFELDPNLHDVLLDGLTGFSVHDELTALVEACHLLDIKVVIDFIPRVTARNSAFIREHPEWVYWIKNEALEGFAPPPVPELGFFEECTPDKLETVYRSRETALFLDKFSQPPNELNPVLWEKLKQRAEQTGEELLTLVEEQLGITTSPAHSDWINDRQPVWTDITFLRLYKDFHPRARPFLKPDQAPYVLFDTIKCNYYPAEEPNLELWDVLEQAVRFYLQTYGIDGFRIDIGHVLPIPLLERIFDAIRSIRPSAILISEDLFNRNHEKAAATVYNIMLGSGWNIMTDITKENLSAYASELPGMKLHVFACAETADTPRIVSRGGVKLARMIGLFNHFLPNAIPFLTTGFEVNEAQPLNCGLGDNTGGADIPRAFFNVMKIDWTNPKPMLPLLAQLNAFKKHWLSLVTPEAFFVADSPDDALIYGYRDHNRVLLACFNLNADKETGIELNSLIKGITGYRVELDSEFEADAAGKTVDRVRLRPYQGLVLIHHNFGEVA